MCNLNDPYYRVVVYTVKVINVFFLRKMTIAFN